MPKRRILLLGGAGTLGSDILDADFTEYELFIVDDFSESALTEDEVQQKHNYRNMSVADQLGMMKVFQEFKPDFVVYLATTLSSNQRRSYESNVLGMLNTINAAEQTNFPTIIYIQSFLTRRSDLAIDLNSPTEARDSYSTWKLAAEYLLNSYKGKKNTLILASVLSPRLSVGAVPAFVRRIQNGEDIKVTDTYRDYIDSETFISGLKALIENVESEVKILGSGISVSTLDILKFTASSLGLTFDKIKYEKVEPKTSDPQRISLNSDWLNHLQVRSSNIQNSVYEIVMRLIRSQIQARLHH